MQAAESVEKGIPLQPELGNALQHGTSLGGARPKVLITADDRKYIAKFSTSSDIYNVVKSEFVAMTLARLVGLNAATVKLESVLGKDVLLIERFDREKAHKGWQRKAMVSALTLFGLDEMMAMYASYQDLAILIAIASPTRTKACANYLGASYSTFCVATRMTMRVTTLPSGMAKI